MEHERPGVYSVYDASAVVSAGQAPKAVGVAAKAPGGTVGQVVTLTGYAAGVAAFGEDSAPGMSTLLRLLFSNGASTVAAVRVADAGTVEDYGEAFAALERQDAQVLVCDSGELAVQQALRQAVEDASGGRRERIAVVGGSGESVTKLVERASALNSERMVLVGPDALDSAGAVLGASFAAAAVAGAIAAGRDPAVPINGMELKGLGGACQRIQRQRRECAGAGRRDPAGEHGGGDFPGAWHHHPDHHRRCGGRHMAGADHHFDCGRCDSGGAPGTAQ